MVLFFFCLQLGIFLSSLCCWGKSNYLHPCIQCLEETSRCHIFSGSVLIIEKPYSYHWNKLITFIFIHQMRKWLSLGCWEFSENSLIFFGFYKVLLNLQCAYDLPLFQNVDSDSVDLGLGPRFYIFNKAMPWRARSEKELIEVYAWRRSVLVPDLNTVRSPWLFRFQLENYLL